MRIIKKIINLKFLLSKAYPNNKISSATLLVVIKKLLNNVINQSEQIRFLRI